MEDRWHGIFAIPQTPFDANGRLDEESLRNEIVFCIRAGAHGIVAPVVASEFYILSDEERALITHILVEEVRGRVPVIIGVTASGKEQAVAFSRIAGEAGADGLIAMPPHVMKARLSQIYAYYQAISDAVALPVFIQNTPPPLGSSLSPSFMLQLCREIEHVEYIKEETMPTGHQITTIIDAGEPAVKGVFGGAAARWMIPELARGAAGFMPACQFTDIYVKIWDLWQAGDHVGARILFDRLLPIINLESMLSVSLVKEILVRRGVIREAHIRRPDGVRLDRYDTEEMEWYLEALRPYLNEVAISV